MLESILLPFRKNSVCSTVCDFKFNETKPILLFANTGVVPGPWGVTSILNSFQSGDLSTDPHLSIKKIPINQTYKYSFYFDEKRYSFSMF